MTNTNRREKRRITKASKNKMSYLETQIKIALAGDQYKALGADMTEEEMDIAVKLFEVLEKKYSPDKGLTINELASALLGDPDAKYTKELLFKIERTIQWMKKAILQDLLEYKPDKRFGFIICKIGDRYFNGGADPKYVQSTFEYYGLKALPKDSFQLKGGAIISFENEPEVPIPEELKHLKGKERDEAMKKLYPVEVTLDNEGNDVMQNIKGHYTTEKGGEELIYISNAMNDYIIRNNLKQVTDVDLVPLLFPEVGKPTADNLELFNSCLVKIRDALYIKTGETAYIKHKINDGPIMLQFD